MASPFDSSTSQTPTTNGSSLASSLGSQPSVSSSSVPEPAFPPIAEACFFALQVDESLRMPGLFVEGDDSLDEKAVSLLEQFDRGKSPPLQSRSPLLVAILLKRWLATLDFAIFSSAAGDLLVQAHLRPTPQQVLEQFRVIVSSLQPVPFHLLRRLTAALRAYLREHEKIGDVQLQDLGDLFAPLVMWMPLRDPLRVRPTNEQLGGVPAGHVLVQVNVPPMGFTTRLPLPLNVTISRLRAQMLTAAGATSMFGWHMWLAPPNPQLMDPSCTLRQYNVQNTDIIVINNEDVCEKPVYLAAASSVIRCVIKNHPVFFPEAALSPRSSAGGQPGLSGVPGGGAPSLARRSSMSPNVVGGAPQDAPGGVPMLQRRSTVAGALTEQSGQYMAPSLDIFKNGSPAPGGAAAAGASPFRPAAAQPGPTKPPSLRASMQRTNTELNLPPAAAIVPSPFKTSGDLASPFKTSGDIPSPGVRREGSGGLAGSGGIPIAAGGNNGGGAGGVGGGQAMPFATSSPQQMLQQQQQQQQFNSPMGGGGGGSPAAGSPAAAMSPGLQRRDVANRPRAQTPMVLDRPLPAMTPSVASPSPSPAEARRQVGQPPARAKAKPVVRDAYQPLADARRRGMLGASNKQDDEANGDDADGAAGGDNAQYQDIPSKWAPDIANSGVAATGTASPRSLPVMPAGVRRSEEPTHYGSSKMLQQGIAGVPKAGLGRPSFDIRDDRAPF